MFLSVVSILLSASPALGADYEDYGDYIVGGTEVSPKYRLGYQALFKVREGLTNYPSLLSTFGGQAFNPPTLFFIINSQ